MRGAEPAGTSRAAHSGQSSGRAQLGAHHGAGLMGSHLLEGCGAWGRPSSVSRPHDAGAGGRVGAQRALLRGIPGPFLWRMPTNQFFPGFAPLHRALCLGRWGMSRLTRSAQSSHRLLGLGPRALAAVCGQVGRALRFRQSVLEAENFRRGALTAHSNESGPWPDPCF